jgi:hypothetical protein
MGQRELGSTACSSGCFDDAQPITALRRKGYRERSDLQEAFPDPLATASHDCSYYHWFEASDESRVAPLWQKLADVRARIRELENSWSWRLSAPLRVVGGFGQRVARAFREAGPIQRRQRLGGMRKYYLGDDKTGENAVILSWR